MAGKGVNISEIETLKILKLLFRIFALWMLGSILVRVSFPYLDIVIGGFIARLFSFLSKPDASYFILELFVDLS